MKKLILFALVVLVFSFENTFAQESDTLIIEPVYQGSPFGAINKQINGDVDGDGNRLHKVYKLRAGHYYLLSAKLDLSFDLNLVGEEPDPNDPAKFPAVITSGVKDNGGKAANLTLMARGKNITLKNIYFHGVPQKVGRMESLVKIQGDSINAHIEACYFEGSWMHSLFFLGNMIDAVVENCHFRNIYANGGHYNGRGIWFHNSIPNSAIIRNNTFMNLNSYAFCIKGDGWAKKVVFDHNTVVNISCNPIRVWRATDLTITNNIIYNGQYLGSNEQEWVGNWNDLDEERPSIFSIDTLPGDWADTYADYPEISGIAEAERKVIIQNNAVFWQPEVEQAWDNYEDTASTSFARTLIMNDRTTAMFADDANYPELLHENSFTEDPGFVQSTPVDTIIKRFVSVREGGGGYSWGWGFYDNVEANWFVVNWPLPENFTYSNTAYKTGGTDGLALGDLKWDRETSGIANPTLNSQPDFTINCYPNPFIQSTTINFEVMRPTTVSVKVFNLLGQNVGTLLDNMQVSSGENSLEWHGTDDNGNQLSNGMYLIVITDGAKYAIKKVTLL